MAIPTIEPPGGGHGKPGDPRADDGWGTPWPSAGPEDDTAIPPPPPMRAQRAAPPRTRRGAARHDAVPLTETVRVTARDLRRRAEQERTQRRLVLTTLGFAAMFAAVLLRLAWVTVLFPLAPPKQRPPIATLLQDPTKPIGAALVNRAMITDRDGQILAISLPAAALYADPREIIDPAQVAAKLKTVLPDLDLAMATRRLGQTDKRFVYLAFRITPEQEEAINALGIPGVEFQPTEIRRYPMGRLAAQVLGGVDVDAHGIAGVEKAFDHRLLTDPAPLRLSLDVRVQAVLRDELARAMDQFHAIGATAIVMKVDTGEVLAMVSLPDYDANDFAAAPPEARFNRAASGVYEPGSTFKLQTAAMALDDGVIHVWDRFDTVHKIHIGRFTITDFEQAHYDYALPELIAQSSNIGASHIALMVGRARQRAFLRRNGMFAPAPIQLPESAPPLVQPKRAWGEASVMTVSFGNGIAVTPIQLITGTASLINGGVYHPPTLRALATGEVPSGRKVLRPEVSLLMRKLMRDVLLFGTGKQARVTGYLMGAKTGTSQKVARGGYRQHTNLASMIAAFPMTDPKYIIYAMLDSPKGDKSTFGFSTGGAIAGPVIRRTVARIAPMLGLLPAAPDALPALQEAIALPLAPPIPPGAVATVHGIMPGDANWQYGVAVAAPPGTPGVVPSGPPALPLPPLPPEEEARLARR
ncbi:MAG: penicillin-binding protein 2 [Rhodospirillales bacterium]|nr:penicillin-binding protein 2 [Rhodospirillales bacterium]